MGGFTGLNKHDDSKPYSKTEPPSVTGDILNVEGRDR
jgi:hypothetical protein